jgi:hypothetical protein
MTTRPRLDDEPLVGIEIANRTDTDGRTLGGPGWVVLGWRPDAPERLWVWGPFTNRTMAMAFGRVHYPRRYRVAGMHDPDLAHLVLTGRRWEELNSDDEPD